MPIYHITRGVLERVAQAISRSFHDDAIYSEQAAADERFSGLIIHNPAGPETADIMLHFPAGLLERLETLGPRQSAIAAEHIRKVTAERLTVYQRERDAGSLGARDRFLIEFDKRILDDIAQG